LLFFNKQILQSVIPSQYLKFAEIVGSRLIGPLDYKQCAKSLRPEESGTKVFMCYPFFSLLIIHVRKPDAAFVLLFNNLLLPRGLADVWEFVRAADTLVKVGLLVLK